MKEKHKILLSSVQNAFSEDIDLFLNIDLKTTFEAIVKEKYDNDFDLFRQFERERDACRNFRVYGEIHSNVIDCDNITIKVFSDENYQNLITELTTTPVSYNTVNVFGKKRGKYLLEQDNYSFDNFYFLIESDNFFFEDQKWSQKVVFKDAEGNFVSYGNETAEVQDDGSIEIIENNFPFFFHKHWVKKDFNIIEEKENEFTWNIPESSISEGEEIDITLSLKKPSVFGNESLVLQLSEKSTNDKYKKGNLKTLPNNQQYIFNFNDRVHVFVENNSSLIDFYSPGRSLMLLDGDYQGEYLILNNLIPEDLGINDAENILILELDFEYQNNFSNNNTTKYLAGSFPDIELFLENQKIKLPFEVSWNEGEQKKEFTIKGLNDFEIEFDELFKIEATDLIRVKPGVYPTHTLTLKDSTVPKKVRYNFQEIYENRLYFSGRTVYPEGYVEIDGEEIDTSDLKTVEGPSILRNGLLWEGRNEEFYPNDYFDLIIRNEGIKTVLPENPSIGVLEPEVFEPLEEKTFRINSSYNQSNLNSYTVTFTQNDHQIGVQINITTEEVSDFIINGCPIISKENVPANQFTNSFTYLFLKNRLNESSNDIFVQNLFEKFFTVSFNDSTGSITFTSKNPGVKLNITTKNPFIEITENNPYIPAIQSPKSLILYANSNQNQDSRYSFEIRKSGYKPIHIPPENIQASDLEIKDVYLSTSYENILYPYDSQLQQSFFRMNANDVVGTTLVKAIEEQPSYMEKGRAYINGTLLLSEGSWPGSKQNITETAPFDPDVDTEGYSAKFLPEPINVIPDTSELISPNGTKGVWQILIKNMESVPNYHLLSGNRSFDIEFQVGSENYSWTIGGQRPNDTIELTKGAQQWWQAPIPIKVNGVTLSPMTLSQRLSGESQEGEQETPFTGLLLSPEILQIQAKEFGLQFSINNLNDFNGYTPSGTINSVIQFFQDIFTSLGWFGFEEGQTENVDNFYLRAVQISPSLNPGDLNIGRNGLGGFSLSQ